MKTSLKISGMHCDSCETLVSEALEDVGVKVLKINGTSGLAEIEFSEQKISLEQIKAIIRKEGYKVQ